MALQTANQFQLVPQASFIPGVAQGQQVAQGRQQLARGEQALAAGDQDASLRRAQFIGNSVKSLRALPLELRAGAMEQLRPRLAEFGIDPGAFQGADLSDASLDQTAASVGALGRQQGAGQRAFAPVTDPATGEIGVPTFDPSTGQAGFQRIEGAPLQRTPEEKRLTALETKRAEAEIDVAKTEKKEIIKQKVARTSKIKTELSTRNRGAARSGRTLRQALTLAQQASQGLRGAGKLKLSRLIPGIDATDEAALDATLKQLALEQLQQFKGPTTDFEFGVTQAIAGDLGQSKESNIARIKSLDRARFFNERELTQFNKFTKQGGDADNFRFDFNEKIVTKKGPFTLQDIQDTAVQNNLTIEETITRLNK